MNAPLSYRQRRDVKLALRRDRRIARLKEGPRPERTSRLSIDDPLLREARQSRRPARAALLVVGAAIAHVVALVVIYFAATVASKIQFSVPDPKEKIEVAVIDRTPTPEPPKVEEKPEEIVEPPKVEKKKVIVPPADPIDTPPKEESKEPPKETSAPVVGLDAESTTKDGNGPSFATGNTRMGETEKVAKDASDIAPLPKSQKPNPLVVAPKSKGQVKPAYPSEYEQLGLEDTVTLSALVGSTGKTRDVSFVKESEHGLFNLAAKRAMLREEFAPATKDGAPVAMRITRKYNFQLSGEL